MRAPELLDGVKLAAKCPGTRFILDHCGNPDLKCFRTRRIGEVAPAHTADAWKRSIDALAKQPNVICKISGVAAGLPPEGEAEDLAPVVNHCLDTFGPDCVVFGGDWPVCLLGATYQKWVHMLRQIIASRSHAHQMQLWSGNALRFYELRPSLARTLNPQTECPDGLSCRVTSSALISGDAELMAHRWMTLRSSRTFPGQA